MKFFGQGETETRYGLDFRSYFATLGRDDRFERALARAACGEKFDGWRFYSGRVIIPKTGFLLNSGAKRTFPMSRSCQAGAPSHRRCEEHRDERILDDVAK